jgi:GntR family transcriptional regulator/MocR family aminotransferase
MRWLPRPPTEKISALWPRGHNHENGSVESSHRYLKDAVDQALMLRGHRDFADRAAYDEFVREVVMRRNRRNAAAFRIEREQLQDLPERRTTDFVEDEALVTRCSTFTVRGILYSAPSRLIGHRLKVRIYGDRLDCYLSGALVHSTPRGSRADDNRHALDYRHFIDSLRRKPQAFKGLAFRDALFPREAYRRTWERLEAQLDADGLNVDYGIETAADAALAVLTPGQQAPLGSTLSLRRRLQLIEWAASSDAWIIEDDYLGELQLQGRPAPAMASLGEGNRVIHIGSFSKTVSPALRLGFVVAPTELANAFSEVAATLAPAPSPVVQLATAQFMRDGHYIRRVRRLKRLYSAQRDGLCEQLRMRDAEWVNAGLAVLLRLPDNAPDVRIVREAMTVGMAPSPLSVWFANPSWTLPGLLLGVATAPEKHLATSCQRLFEIIDRYR